MASRSRQLGDAPSAGGPPLAAAKAQLQRPTGASRIGRLSRTAALLAVAIPLPLWGQGQQGGLRVPSIQYQVQRLSPKLTVVASPNPPGSAAAPVVAVLTRVARAAMPGYRQTTTTVPVEQLTAVLSTAALRVRGATRAVIVIAGAIAPATVLPQAAHILSVLPGGPAPAPPSASTGSPPQPPASPPASAAPRMLTITWPGPAAGATDTAALAMLGEDLFAGPAARERRSLVDKWRAALAVRGGLNGPAGWSAYHPPGHFLAQLWFRPAVSPTLVRELVFRQIHEIEVNGISPDELRRTEIWTAADWLRRGQTAAARARRLARAFWDTGSPQAANEALRPMLAVTAQQMQAAAARYLSDAQARLAATGRRPERQRAPVAGRPTPACATACWGPRQSPAAATPGSPTRSSARWGGSGARWGGGTSGSVQKRAAEPLRAGPAAPWGRGPLARGAAFPRSAPAWLPAWRPPAPAFDAQFQNGLRLIVIPDANIPLVTAQLSVRAAPAGQARWSRALARVLAGGSAGASGAALADRLQGIGGTLWARAGRRRFTIGASALSPYAGILLRRLAAIAIRPAIPAAAVARERLNAPAWRAWRRGGQRWLARRTAARLLVHAPAPPPLLDQKNLLAFAHQLLLPNNDARLVVVGHVDPAWVQSLVEQYFVDAWPFGNPFVFPPREKFTASRLFLVNVPGPRAAFAFASAASLPPAGSAAAAAWRLARRLALSAGAVFGAAAAAQLPDALRQALVRRARLAAAPVAAAQLQGLKARLLRRWMRAWQAQGAIAGAWTAGQPPAEWTAIAAVTPAQLQAAARRYLSPAVIVVAGSAQALAAPLSRLRGAPVPILNAQGQRIGVYPPQAPLPALPRARR